MKNRKYKKKKWKGTLDVRNNKISNICIINPRNKSKRKCDKRTFEKIMAGNLLNLAKYIILQIRKWENDFNRHFAKEFKHMAT